MRTPSRAAHLAATAAIALITALLSASPAHAAVALTTSASSAPPTTLVTFSGTAPNGPVSLQRRKGTGPWGQIRTGTVSSGQFSFSVRVAVGAYLYRAVAGAQVSSAKQVVGLYGRNVWRPAPGAPFTFTGQLPTEQARTVQFQYFTNGAWKTWGQSTSSTSGLAGVRTYLGSTVSVRLYAPATGSAAAWAGPASTLTIGSDYVISRILQDTNNFRAANGRAALKLYWPLNKVAGDWAYKMHQNCNTSNWDSSFFHNQKPQSATNYWELYPAGWTGAAENIAAGQTYTSVVNGWINSPPHRANLLGAYTHIGIGYYFGSKCYQRYYVQNFARY